MITIYSPLTQTSRTIRVGQIARRDGVDMRLVGYDVYTAPDGSVSTYYGRHTTLRDARSAPRRCTGAHQSLWATGAASGDHRLKGPDTDGVVIDWEPVDWCGRDGYIVAVWQPV